MMRKVIRTKIVGVTAHDAEGLSRQDVIRKYCAVGDRLLIERDTGNPVHERAVRVSLRKNKRRLGYLKAKLADVIHTELASGARISARIIQLTGGVPGKEFLGVNIELDIRRGRFRRLVWIAVVCAISAAAWLAAQF